MNTITDGLVQVGYTSYQSVINHSSTKQVNTILLILLKVFLTASFEIFLPLRSK